MTGGGTTGRERTGRGRTGEVLKKRVWEKGLKKNVSEESYGKTFVKSPNEV